MAEEMKTLVDRLAAMTSIVRTRTEADERLARHGSTPDERAARQRKALDKIESAVAELEATL